MTTSWAGPFLGAGGPGPGGLAGVETLGRQFWRGLVAQDRVLPSADGGKHEVFILPLRAQDHFILYCEGELDGRQIRVARLLGEGPASQPCQAPPAPFPCAFCSGEAPEEAAGPTLWLGVRGGRGGRRMPASVSGAGLVAHQATPCGITLGSAPRGCLRWDSGVCMELEREGNSSSWGFITGTRLRQALERQDLPARGQEVPRVTEGPCGQEQSGRQLRGRRGLPPGQTFYPQGVCRGHFLPR